MSWVFIEELLQAFSPHGIFLEKCKSTIYLLVFMNTEIISLPISFLFVTEYLAVVVQ